MGNREINQCECRECQEGNEAIRKEHENLNLLMSRLDEQQRRWMAALEAKKIGHGGTFDPPPDLSSMELSLSSPPGLSSKYMKLFLYKPLGS